MAASVLVLPELRRQCACRRCCASCHRRRSTLKPCQSRLATFLQIADATDRVVASVQAAIERSNTLEPCQSCLAALLQDGLPKRTPLHVQRGTECIFVAMGELVTRETMILRTGALDFQRPHERGDAPGRIPIELVLQAI